MKISVLITQEGKQIMMTPENDHEKSALKMIAPGDKLEVATKWGSYSGEMETYGRTIGMNQAGYFRAWESQESLMFVIQNKESDKD